MPHEPIHYVPVVEQRFAQILENLDQHPARNQWSRFDRERLAADIHALATSTRNIGPGDETIPMAVDRLIDVADWLPGAVDFYPVRLKELLWGYVAPKT